MDITVKGNSVGKLYAPTWDMVRGFQHSRISQAEYTRMYYELIQQRWRDDYLDFRGFTLRLVGIICGGKEGMPPRDITLVCFCKADSFCHRYLLVRWITHNWPAVKYGGERYV